MKLRHLCFVVLFVSCGWLQAQERETLTMVGTGIAYAVPDRATVDLVVTSIDTDPRDALSSDKKAVRNALEKLAAERIDPRNISTSDISIERLNTPSGMDQQFAASTTLRVTALPVNMLGQILDRAMTSDIQGLRASFYASNPDSVESLAIADAVVDATRKATKFSETFKLKLGKLLNIKSECSATESVRSTYEGPLNIYKVSELSKTLLVIPPRVAYSARVEGIFEFSARE
jgi:uncharacterized protein